MARSRRAEGRKRVSAKRWREEVRGGSNYLKIPAEVGVFQPKAETYRLDFMPFVAGKGNPRAEPGEVYFERTFFVHQAIGPNQDWHLCLAKTLKKPCPVCEFRAKQMADPHADEDNIKALAPKERQLWLLRNLKEDPEALLLWEVSYHLFGRQIRDKINNSDEEDGYDYFADPEEGYTVRVAFQQSERGKWLETADIEFRKRSRQYDPDVAGEMPCLDDLLVATPYEKLKQIFLQAEGADEDRDEEERPAGARRRPKRDSDEDDDPAPPETRKKSREISSGDVVGYKGNRCEVVKVSRDGTSLILEECDGGELHKPVGVDDLDDDPPEEKPRRPSKPERKKKEPEPEPDDADEDDGWDWPDDDEPEKQEKSKKSGGKKGKAAAKDADDKDWDEGWPEDEDD